MATPTPDSYTSATGSVYAGRVVPAPPPPPPAPSITLSASGSATVGVPYTITALAANLTGALVGTPENVTGSAVFDPTTINPAPGELSKLFSATYAAAGNASVRVTAPGGVVSNTLAITVASASPPPPPPPPPPAPAGNWVERSTADGVVWAHNFENDAEVTNHLLNSDPTGNAVIPRRVIDESGLGCLEQVILGAEIAVAYTAGSPTMVIDDAHLWPDPAVTGPFYFMACEKLPNVGRKNLFLCTARSGTTLTVSLYASPVSSVFVRDPVTFLQVAQSYAVGDYVGQESTSEWRRVFAALPAGENGKDEDDPGDGGAVPLRSRLTGNALSVPRDPSLWQYGWYTHPANQALWDDLWTPWQGASTLTPRGASLGADPRFRLVDGNEFWLQFRTRIDPRFWEKHVLPDPSGTDSAWGRKFWALQSELSSTNQLVTGIAPSNRFAIPDTNPNPFSLTTYKAARVVGVSDWNRPSGISYQKGSPWDVAPHFANLSTSFKPSTGAPTPDGSAAWEHKDDEWVTWLVRVKPGRSGVPETEIEVKFARTEDPAYTGEYTTLLNVTDANIVYSGSGDYDYPDGAFSYPEVTTMNALPGFQAFGLMGYLNIGQTVGIPPSRASYYVRMAQVILSRQPIAPPVSDVALPLPSWVPEPNNVAVLTSGSGLLNNFRDAVAPGYQAFYSKKIVNDYAGAVKNKYWGDYGATMWFGSGHSSGSNDNSVMVLEYQSGGLMFKRAVDPTNWASAGGTNDGSNPPITGLVAQPWLESTIDGKPLSPHSWQVQAIQGPEDGGATYGTFWNVFSAAVGDLGLNARAAYKLPITSLSLNGSTWARGSADSVQDGLTSYGAPLLVTYVPTQNRFYITANAGSDTQQKRWFDPVTGQYVTGTGLNFRADLSDQAGSGDISGRTFFASSRNLEIYAGRFGGSLVFEYADMSSADPTRNTTPVVLSQAVALPLPWTGACWNPVTEKILVFGCEGGAVVYEITIPTDVTATWQVFRRPLPAGQTFGNQEALGSYANGFGKFDFDEKVRSVVYMPLAVDSGSDTVYVYRPFGT